MNEKCLSEYEKFCFHIYFLFFNLSTDANINTCLWGSQFSFTADGPQLLHNHHLVKTGRQRNTTKGVLDSGAVISQLNVNFLICRWILMSGGAQQVKREFCAYHMLAWECKFCFLHFLPSSMVTGSLCSFPVCRCLHRTKVTFVTFIWPLTVAAVTPAVTLHSPNSQNLSFHTPSLF